MRQGCKNVRFSHFRRFSPLSSRLSKKYFRYTPGRRIISFVHRHFVSFVLLQQISSPQFACTFPFCAASPLPKCFAGFTTDEECALDTRPVAFFTIWNTSILNFFWNYLIKKDSRISLKSAFPSCTSSPSSFFNSPRQQTGIDKSKSRRPLRRSGIRWAAPAYASPDTEATSPDPQWSRTSSAAMSRGPHCPGRTRWPTSESEKASFQFWYFP